MPVYFFVIIVFSCLVFHFLFGRSRKRKLTKVSLPLHEKLLLERLIDTNTQFSIITISICVFASILFGFFPEIYPILFPIKTVDIDALDYLGMFFVKISFITSIVVHFQISDKFDFEFLDLTKQNIERMESLSLFSTILLCTGVFIFIPNIITAVVFIASLSYFMSSRFLS